jgi:hypothetical protein
MRRGSRSAATTPSETTARRRAMRNVDGAAPWPQGDLPVEPVARTLHNSLKG